MSRRLVQLRVTYGSRGEALSSLRRARSEIVGYNRDVLSAAIYTSGILPCTTTASHVVKLRYSVTTFELVSKRFMCARSAPSDHIRSEVVTLLHSFFTCHSPRYHLCFTSPAPTLHRFCNDFAPNLQRFCSDIAISLHRIVGNAQCEQSARNPCMIRLRNICW